MLIITVAVLGALTESVIAETEEGETTLQLPTLFGGCPPQTSRGELEEVDTGKGSPAAARETELHLD